jgi:hypothetical protein
MLIPVNGRFTTLLGHTSGVANRPIGWRNRPSNPRVHSATEPSQRLLNLRNQ